MLYSEKACEVENLHKEEELATMRTETVITKDEALVMDAVIIDVRTSEEYEAGHMERALNIPYTNIHSQAKLQIPDKKCPVFTVSPAKEAVRRLRVCSI